MINGCNNRPRPVANKPLLVQDGYVPGMFTYEAGHTDRIDRIVTVPYVMSTECQYTASATDPGCAGCAHAPHLRELQTCTAVRNALFPGPSIGEVLAAKDAEIAGLNAALARAPLPDQEAGQ